MSRMNPFNVVLVGESGVGKTSLILRLCFGRFTLESPTLCTEYFYHEIEAEDGKIYNLEVVDTAGQERFRPIVANFYRRAQGAFVVFDLQNSQSFIEAKGWVRELRSRAPNLQVIILVGNKLDFASSLGPAVRKEVLNFAERYGLSYYEASARADTNVSTIFLAMAKELAESEAKHQRYLEAVRLNEEATRHEEEVMLWNPSGPKKRKCC